MGKADETDDVLRSVTVLRLPRARAVRNGDISSVRLDRWISRVRGDSMSNVAFGVDWNLEDGLRDHMSA